MSAKEDDAVPKERKSKASKWNVDDIVVSNDSGRQYLANVVSVQYYKGCYKYFIHYRLGA